MHRAAFELIREIAVRDRHIDDVSVVGSRI